MSLLRDVVALLEAGAIDHALIGAAAMALHGVSRATADIDILTVDTQALRADMWTSCKARGATLRLLRGDADDPLAGNVRLSSADGRIVDVVVGRFAWQREIIMSARSMSIGEIAVKVVSPAGLVLLKLHAGGAKDAWDIRALLEAHEEAGAIRDEVDRLVHRLPAECVDLWSRLRSDGA